MEQLTVDKACQVALVYVTAQRHVRIGWIDLDGDAMRWAEAYGLLVSGANLLLERMTAGNGDDDED
jgi:hypothetical protein